MQTISSKNLLSSSSCVATSTVAFGASAAPFVAPVRRKVLMVDHPLLRPGGCPHTRSLVLLQASLSHARIEAAPASTNLGGSSGAGLADGPPASPDASAATSKLSPNALGVDISNAPWAFLASAASSDSHGISPSLPEALVVMSSMPCKFGECSETTSGGDGGGEAVATMLSFTVPELGASPLLDARRGAAAARYRRVASCDIVTAACSASWAE
eukprot:6213689-Prymnesium_polylepis.1